jgi:hypothetical protein
MVKNTTKTCSLQRISTAREKKRRGKRDKTHSVTPSPKNKSKSNYDRSAPSAPSATPTTKPWDAASSNASTVSEASRAGVERVICEFEQQNEALGLDAMSMASFDTSEDERVLESSDKQIDGEEPEDGDVGGDGLKPNYKDIGDGTTMGVATKCVFRVSAGTLRSASSEDPTIQDLSRPLKGWTLIHFNEFSKLKMNGKLVVTEQMRWRLGPGTGEEGYDREVIRMRDLRKAVLDELATQLKSIMLQEARKEFPSIGKRAPHSWDDIRNSWARDSSIPSAQLTWHLMYGIFDQLDMSGSRNSPKWERKLEKKVMEKMNLAYIRETIPSGKSLLFVKLYEM